MTNSNNQLIWNLMRLFQLTSNLNRNVYIYGTFVFILMKFSKATSSGWNAHTYVCVCAWLSLLSVSFVSAFHWIQLIADKHFGFSCVSFPRLFSTPVSQSLCSMCWYMRRERATPEQQICIIHFVCNLLFHLAFGRSCLRRINRIWRSIQLLNTPQGYHSTSFEALYLLIFSNSVGTIPKWMSIEMFHTLKIVSFQFNSIMNLLCVRRVKWANQNRVNYVWWYHHISLPRWDLSK